MHQLTLTRAILCMGLSALFLASPSQSQEIRVALEKPSLPFPARGPNSERVDPSAVEPIKDTNLLLVANDKSSRLLVVEATSREIKAALRISKDETNYDWEGMTRDSDEYYYVIGSGSHMRRFHLGGDGTDKMPLQIDQVTVEPFDMGAAISAGDSIEIEGLAIRTRTGPNKETTRELVVGFRQPYDPVRVFAADITKTPAGNAGLVMRLLFKFDAGKLNGIPSQLSSIEYVPAWQGFLILTAAEDRRRFNNNLHGSTLWFLKDDEIAAATPDDLRPENFKLAKPQEVRVFSGSVKAEGLCVVSEGPVAGKSPMRQARIAITYDNDAESAGSSLQFLNLTLGDAARLKKQ